MSQIISYSSEIAWQPTPFNLSLGVQQFNPSLGQLIKVELWFNWQNDRYAVFLGGKGHAYEATYSGDVIVSYPSGAIFQQEYHEDWSAGLLNENANVNIHPYSSGSFHKATCDPLIGMAPAVANWIGTGNLPFQANLTGAWDFTGTNFENGDVQLATQSKGTIKAIVYYTYNPGLTGTAFPCH